jgi:hypothetical protein
MPGFLSRSKKHSRRSDSSTQSLAIPSVSRVRFLNARDQKPSTHPLRPSAISFLFIFPFSSFFSAAFKARLLEQKTPIAAKIQKMGKNFFI